MSEHEWSTCTESQELCIMMSLPTLTVPPRTRDLLRLLLPLLPYDLRTHPNVWNEYGAIMSSCSDVELLAAFPVTMTLRTGLPERVTQRRRVWDTSRLMTRCRETLSHEYRQYANTHDHARTGPSWLYGITSGVGLRRYLLGTEGDMPFTMEHTNTLEYKTVNRLMCERIREVYPQPHHYFVDEDVLGWQRHNAYTVKQVAEDIHASGNYEELPVLADALQDAGCADDYLLGHLRSGDEVCPTCGGQGWYDAAVGPNEHDTPECGDCLGQGHLRCHARGCWAVALCKDEPGIGWA